MAARWRAHKTPEHENCERTEMILQGDCLEVLKTIKDNSVDSLVTDPPAGISFMSKAWDGSKGGRDGWVEWLTQVMLECHRVLKPGAHGLIWAIPRTSHWTAWAIESAGFEIRDSIHHIFGSGFPKSHDISKAIDKAAGAEREKGKVLRTDPNIKGASFKNAEGRIEIREEIPATPEAKQWDGWGTALKPAHEVWWLVRKPLSEKNVAQNVLKHGTGGLNINGTRIEFKDDSYDRHAKEQFERQNRSGVKVFKCFARNLQLPI
jgi:hypothetical protein